MVEIAINLSYSSAKSDISCSANLSDLTEALTHVTKAIKQLLSGNNLNLLLTGLYSDH